MIIIWILRDIQSWLNHGRAHIGWDSAWPSSDKSDILIVSLTCTQQSQTWENLISSSGS